MRPKCYFKDDAPPMSDGTVLGDISGYDSVIIMTKPVVGGFAAEVVTPVLDIPIGGFYQHFMAEHFSVEGAVHLCRMFIAGQNADCEIIVRPWRKR